MSIQNICVSIMLTVGSIQDLQRKKLAVKMLLAFMVTGVALDVVFVNKSLAEVIGGVLLGLSICALSAWTRGSIGMGDGWMLVNCGLYLGFFETMWIFFIGSLLCACTAGILWITGRAGRKSELPFIPFLFGGYLLMLLEGFQ